jgi:hypothetical protein
MIQACAIMHAGALDGLDAAEPEDHAALVLRA